MSFIIKGFDTDGNCLHCYFQSEDSDRCILTDDDIPLYGKGHPNSCPLVPLPAGHGRLGDLDALMSDFAKARWEFFSDGDTFLRLLKNAPTIVPAEGTESE